MPRTTYYDNFDGQLDEYIRRVNDIINDLHDGVDPIYVLDYLVAFRDALKSDRLSHPRVFA